MEVSSWKSFDGEQKIFSHESKVLGCSMKYAVYLPPGPGPFPVLWYLSGLTCTEQNCVQKGGFQQYASSNNIGLIISFGREHCLNRYHALNQIYFAFDVTTYARLPLGECSLLKGSTNILPFFNIYIIIFDSFIQW